MPDLMHSLYGRDLGFLRMVAGLWGIELGAPNVRSALPLLVKAMLNPELANEIVESLPPPAGQALQALAKQGGMLPWTQFTRQYGEVQSMGTAKRDRERPDLHPSTPTEMLWYYGLVSQAFLDQPPEPQQYAYIPEDLFAIIHIPGEPEAAALGRPARSGESAVVLSATDRVLDHACTILAALRLGLSLDQIQTEGWNIPLRNLQALLFTAGLTDGSGIPLPEPVRKFLEAPRGEAIVQLASSWIKSTSYNELRLLSGLTFEGEWVNDPLSARTRLIEHLTRLPQDTWWNLDSFIEGLRLKDPDFQRPAGDYDSWFIRRSSSGEYLSGFSSWDEVDGALARSLITGPLHWLGYYDLAAPALGMPVSAFRPSSWADNLRLEIAPNGIEAETTSVTAYPDGRLDLPRLTQRALRYQLARFTSWLGEDEHAYHYRVTPAALEHARQQGLRTNQLVNLLRKHAGTQFPPSLAAALDRWDQQGTEVHIESTLLLRVSRPEILAVLRKHRAARFLGEELTPTIILVRPGGVDAVLHALTELGYLGEAHLGSEV